MTEHTDADLGARVEVYRDEWAWHEDTDDRLAGYGNHMSQMLYRLPRDGQTDDMRKSIESMLDDLIALLDRLAHAERIAAVHSGFGGGPSCAEQITILTDRLARAEALAGAWEHQDRFFPSGPQYAVDLRAALADDQPEEGA